MLRLSLNASGRALRPTAASNSEARSWSSRRLATQQQVLGDGEVRSAGKDDHDFGSEHETGRALDKILLERLFAVVREHAIEGLFCDPVYGGNRNAVGWRLVGLPGVHDYDPTVLWGAPITSWSGDFQPLEIAHAMPADAPRWGKGWRNWMRDNYTRITSMYSQTANIPTAETYVDLDPDRKDQFGQPALRMTHGWGEADQRGVAFLLEQRRKIAKEMGLTYWWEETTAPKYHLSTHECGTHRMGEDPAKSVVDIFGKSHECANLYVIGGGQFPTYHGYNPTQTIHALAYMTVDHMLDRPMMTSAVRKNPARAQPATAGS